MPLPIATPTRVAFFVRGDGQAALFHRHGRRGERELDEARALFDVFLLDPVERIEALHLAREAGAWLLRVK